MGIARTPSTLAWALLALLGREDGRPSTLAWALLTLFRDLSMGIARTLRT